MPTFSFVDAAVFIGFIGFVVAFGVWMSRKTDSSSSESYFLASRGLAWWLIGFSLIAANISTEQFVGMSGSAARPVGLAIAGYEWLAAVTLVFVGFFFLPIFLRTGIYTIPEFFEKRYGPATRLIMSLCMVVMLVAVNLTAVLYSGAITLEIFFGDGLSLQTACWIVGIVSAIYVMMGGLKACAWADFLQGSALIIGGVIILFLALAALDKAPVEKIAASPEMAQQLEGKTAYEKFSTVNSDRLHTIRPSHCDTVPWTALLFGLWIPNFYYWGLNQYIMQRTLGAKSLAHGQGGIVFAAALKLLIPFIVVFPGMMALNLFKDDSLGYAANMKSEAHSKKNQYTVAIFEKTSGENLPEFDVSGMSSTFLDEAQRIADDVKGGSKKIAFDFNADFADLYPREAAIIVNYNTRNFATDPTTASTFAVDTEEAVSNLKPQELVITNAVLLKNVAATNDQLTGSGMGKMLSSFQSLWKGDPPGYIATQKTLIGYDQDAAFPLLLKNLLKSGSGLQGFVLAALMGAVMSSLASMLNAASTIATMDLFKRCLVPNAPDKLLVLTGRILVILFIVSACIVAPMVGHPRFGGIFHYIQEFQGFISPGVLAIFLFGMFARKAPSVCGVVGLLATPVIYGLLKFYMPGTAFLDRMAITFCLVYILLLQLTVSFPRKTPFEFETNTDMEMTPSRVSQVCGVLVVVSVAFLYYYFR